MFPGSVETIAHNAFDGCTSLREIHFIEFFVDSTPKIEDYFQRCIEILSLGREGFAIEIFSE